MKALKGFQGSTSTLSEYQKQVLLMMKSLNLLHLQETKRRTAGTNNAAYQKTLQICKGFGLERQNLELPNRQFTRG